MNEIVVALIASGTLSTIINLVAMAIKDYSDRRKGLKACMRILLDDRLCCLAEKYIDKGEITQPELKIYTKMHEAYKGVGGNGYHDGLIEKLKGLPMKGDQHGTESF